MSEIRVRVTVNDKKQMTYDLMVDGYKVASFKNWFQLHGFTMQALSALGHQPTNQ